MRDRVISGNISNNPTSIQVAIYKTLRDWRRTQQDATVAYQNLCDALRQVNMPMHIGEALQ